MKCMILIVLILCPLPVPGLLGYKLDLLIHLSLRKGGSLPPQTGQYLWDSFRQESFLPEFKAVEAELKNLNTASHWHVIGMMIMSSIGFKANVLLTWKIKQLEKKQGGVIQPKEHV